MTHQGLLGLIRDASGLTTLAQRLGAEPPAAQLGEALDGARASLGTADEELPLERGSGSGEAIALGNIGLETSETVEAGRRDARVSAPLPAFSLQGGSQVDRDSLTRFMRGSVKGVQACYERGLKHNAKLAGQLVVHFTVAEDGRVKDLDIDQDSLGSAEVADCIKATIQSQTTPFRPESEVGVSSPFVFSSL